jgi:mRNA degradation ribonuclease J1/J2
MGDRAADDLLILRLRLPSEDVRHHLLLPGGLMARPDKLRGIFISHGHEDHIGGLLPPSCSIDPPVYASPPA